MAHRPYLHDGSAATVIEVLTTRNQATSTARPRGCPPRISSDLCAYLLSL